MLMAAKIVPFIRGSGMAGQALAHALALFPAEVAAPRWLERDQPLPVPEDSDRTLLVIAEPHALHTPRLLEAAGQGYRFAICEKPAAVDTAQIAQLETLPIETWVCHGYRMLWGPREIARARQAGRFGAIVSIEGRHWQSSATHERSELSWKDDPELAGHHDVLLDLATHWADLMIHLAGRPPESTSVRRWYVNATSPHRDTHVHLDMKFGAIASHGSISKTAHGQGNALDLDVVGEHAVASWSLSEPDTIVWGQRGVHSSQARVVAELPARPAPFHALGWMEGYVRVVGQVVSHMLYDRPSQAPTLAEHLSVLRCLLEAAEREQAAGSG